MVYKLVPSLQPGLLELPCNGRAFAGKFRVCPIVGNTDKASQNRYLEIVIRLERVSCLFHSC